MRHAIQTALTVLTVVLTAACTSTHAERGGHQAVGERQTVEARETPRGPDQAETRPAPVPAAWTDAYLSRALLLANEIRIEGPVGLLDHIAVRSDDDLYDRHVETTSEGFIQTTSAVAGELVRAQLDQWQLAAVARIVVVEKPGELDVLITARGDVLWQDPAGIEKRDNSLTFEGPIER